VSVLIRDIGQLVTNDESWARAGGHRPGGDDDAGLGLLGDAALVLDDGRIEWVGPAARAPAADQVVEAAGRAVLPGFVDSHAHLIFAGERAEEFAARMSGRPYTAGGIRTTVARTRAATDEELRANLRRLVTEMARQGTTTVECKSGYGLNVADERRALRIAAEAADEVTFLGAHVVPAEYAGDPDAYVELVAGDMVRACAPHARWIDVFCERGAFDADQTKTIIDAGAAAGLVPRLHANQLGHGPGVQLAVAAGAASADHCTYLSDADVDALAACTATGTTTTGTTTGTGKNAGSGTEAATEAGTGTGTVATLLPGVEFSTRQPYPDARRLIDAGASVALATDCNPGSCYTSSMALCIALAVREMRMTPAEAVRAATAGGARALRRTDVGHLGVGARADVLMLDAPSYIHLAYRPGVPQVAAVWKRGHRVV
jgi:imidazolonepropionase